MVPSALWLLLLFHWGKSKTCNMWLEGLGSVLYCCVHVEQCQRDQNLKGRSCKLIGM